MADVRQLTVSLLLDSSNFDRNIRLINQQMKEAESEFRLAGAGVENFETTLAGIAAKSQLIRTQLEGQNRSVAQYEARLRQANVRLQESVRQHSEMSEQYRENRADLQLYMREIEETERVLARAREAGDELIVAGLEERLAGQRQAYQEAQTALDRLGGEIESVENSWRQQNATISSTTVQLNNARARVEELNRELALNENKLYASGVAMQAWGERASTAAVSVERVGEGLTRMVTTPIIGLGAATLKASVDYESAFAGVRKTVSYAGDDAEAFFGQLSDSVIEMSKELATGANDIAGVMEIAGQLGIANDELSGFTETVVRLGMSTNMAGEEAASAMARFANITGMQQDMFDEMGSTLVVLGNNFATTEAEIMHMATRIAAAGAQVGMSDQQILGFSAALSSLGIEAEAGGSAFSKAIRMMEVAVQTGSDALGDFAKVAGLTEQEFAKLWKSNPAEAFEAFVVGLSKMDEAGMGAIATLDEIGITELRLSDTLLRSANATKLISDAIDSANAAWEENNALQKESDTRLQTTASRLTNIKNSLVAVGMEFAGTMADEMEWNVDQLKNAVDWLDSMDDATKRNITTWAGYAAVAGPAISVLGKVGGVATSTISGLGKFAQAWGKITTTFKETHSIMGALSAGLGTGGMLMLGIGAATAAVAGLVALYQKLEENKPDFSIDASEIEKYRIDVESLSTKVDMDVGVEVKGEILSLKEKFLGVLNDGVPETQEVRKAMKSDVDAAVEAAYQTIEDSFNAKKTELDGLFESGIIDQQTYDTSLETLKGQATQMEADLTAKSDAVTAYLTTLCNQNRATTEEEIAQLNTLIETLGATAEEVMKANDAQMQAYEWAYEKTRLGIGDEKDARMAAEYIELTADRKLRQIQAEEQALREINAQQMEGLNEEERIGLAERETEALEKLQEKREAVNAEKQVGYAEIIGGIAGKYGLAAEELEAYLQAWQKVEEAEAFNPEAVNYLPGLKQWQGNMMGLGEEVKLLIEYNELLNSVLDKEGELYQTLATAASNGAITEGEELTTVDTLKTLLGLLEQAEESAGKVEESAAGASSSSSAAAKEAAEALNAETGFGWGNEAMRGMKRGIEAGQSGVVRAMRRAARAAVNAAKDELDIHSPSRVMENEVGVEATRGAVRGMLKEAEKQGKVIRNAYRQLTGEAQEGAIVGAGNRRTYNQSSSVSVTGNTFIIRDQLDIQALAVEIASLTQGYQRGRGMKMA